MATATYFLCPHFDYPPGSIELGHIISDPSDPSFCLNEDDLVAPDPSEIKRHLQKNYELNQRQLRDQKSEIITKYLQVFGFGRGSGRDDIEDRIKIEELETRYFKPTSEYLSSSTKSEGVQRFLAGSRFKKSLFLVTGIKVARGAKSSRTDKATGASIGVDVTGIGLPVEVGPGYQVASSWESSKSFQSSSDFIFAFRLSKLKFKERETWSMSAGTTSDVNVEVLLEDAGSEGLRNTVAVKAQDDNEDQSPAVVLYSAESYNKGAILI